jgi:ABC-type amino acid transport substrate-binding protein
LWLLVSAWLLLLPCLSPPYAQAEPIHLSAIELSPLGFNDASKQPQGLYVELTSALAREAGFTPLISVKPYARALMEIHTGKSAFGLLFAGDAVAESAINVAAVHDFDLVLSVPENKGFVQLSDVNGRAIATLAGTSFSEMVSDKGLIRVIPVKSPEQQLWMLQYGRVDAVLGMRQATRLAHGNLQINEKFQLAALHEIDVARVRTHLYISKKRYTSELHARLDQALKRLMNRGEISRIVRQWSLDRRESPVAPALP